LDDVSRGCFLDIGEHAIDPAAGLRGIAIAVGDAEPLRAPTTGREISQRGFVVEEALRELGDVTAARSDPRRFASRLHGRQNQAGQSADDRDNDQEFDERKPAVLMTGWAGLGYHW